jgi:hypothetical protein
MNLSWSACTLSVLVELVLLVWWCVGGRLGRVDNAAGNCHDASCF